MKVEFKPRREWETILVNWKTLARISQFLNKTLGRNVVRLQETNHLVISTGKKSFLIYTKTREDCTTDLQSFLTVTESDSPSPQQPSKS